MSGERVREIRIQTARELEARGMSDKAVDLYLKAGAPAEAARLLVASERYIEAGGLMLETLGVTPAEAGRLEGRWRGAAEKAARCFELGGDADTAQVIRAALGGAGAPLAVARPSIAPDVLPATEPKPSIAPGRTASAPPAAPRSSQPSAPPAPAASDEKWGRASGWRGGAPGTGATDEMIRQLLEQGKKNAAARVAWDAGRLEDAARWFGESGLDYELGAVLYDLGRFQGALEALLRVPHDHKRYRVACTKLVEIATKLGRFDFELDRALTQLAKAPPLEASEVPSYLALAELYATHGFVEGARGALEQVLLFDAAHEGARAALERLPPPPPARGTSSPPARSLRGIVAPGTRALPPLPSLDEFVAEARRNAPKPTKSERRAP